MSKQCSKNRESSNAGQHPPPAASSASGGAVELRDVTIRAGDLTLLEGACARFEPGRVTLIVGCSGAGKSVLLRVLSGLIDGSQPPFAVSGHIGFGERGEQQVAPRRSVGIVFQNFALFDELSPSQNVCLAADHRSAIGVLTRPNDLLDQFNIPPGISTSALSGGQKQRVAIARTLAFDPDVILYDEPTSGLDAATAARVATTIAQTHEHHLKTSIIVTHDYAVLSSIADAIYLLDPRQRSLRLIDRSDWSRLIEFLESPAREETAAVPDRGGQPFRQMATAAGRFFEATANAAMTVVDSPLRLLPLWKSPRWGVRYVLHYLNLVAGPSAWLYIAISGLIIGFVATYFTFRFLPYADYTEPLLIEDLLESMGFALYRILVPVLATILIAARSGAAVASDIGGKTWSNQMDALRTLGAPPQRYLLTGVLYAFLIGTPFLLAVGYAVAAATSLFVFLATHSSYGAMFWELHFHRELRLPGELLYAGTSWLLAKTLLCAAGVGLVAYHRGASPKSSGRDVSAGITTAILWATLYVLVVHFAFSFFEFE